MTNDELVKKYQALKSKHDELLSEKLKCEAKKDQLAAEIRTIQDKYPEYDLTTVESVESIIKMLSDQLDNELTSITEQYNKIKAV